MQELIADNSENTVINVFTCIFKIFGIEKFSPLGPDYPGSLLGGNSSPLPPSYAVQNIHLFRKCLINIRFGQY